jgi:chromosome partitioning protein
MKIAFLAKKGGAGKTTSSLLVAEALRQAGNHVAVQDFDKQGSSTKSLMYSKSEVEIAVPKNEYTYIVFDTPPNLEHPATLVAVREADAVIVVTGQQIVDFWEVTEAVDFAQKTNPRAVVRVLVNKVKTGTILARSVDDSITALKVKALQTHLPDRQVFAHFVGGGGWNVLDRAAQVVAGKLALEIVSLTNSSSLGRIKHTEARNRVAVGGNG